MGQNSEFKMPEGGEFFVTDEISEAFDENGFILVRNLFKQHEIEKLKTFMETSNEVQKHSFERSDGLDRLSKMSLWNYAGDDISGVIARSKKVAGTMEALLGGHEIYHYHSKLMMKDPLTGGAFRWHQDYGYWYQNGCMFPDMGSVFMPVDKCMKENGCLQVLRGSHKLGRIQHCLIGDQAGADDERLSQAKKIFKLVHVEMNPGDALFFHCNLLHGSDQNSSGQRRWVMISSYNQRRNNPVYKHMCPFYHPLNMLPNSAIMECDINKTSGIDKEFMDPKDDKSALQLADQTQ